LQSKATRGSATGAPAGLEWPTLALYLTVYGLFGLLTWYHAVLPWWLVLPLGGYLVALHGSLQHEAVHGHPTRWFLVNEALVFPSLWLWLPFRCYRETHLAHHRNDLLTDPLHDPESYYQTPEAWDRAGPFRRAFLTAHNTVLGRLVMGPALAVWRNLVSEAARFASGDGSHAKPWALHVLGAALVLAWVLGVCGIPFWQYILLYAYPGLSLTLLRSFLEHRARPEVDERSVLIEAGPVMSLLYLNNNLHALHHAEPDRAWYRLPARYRELRESLLAGNGGYRYSGYAEVVARYLVKPKEPVAHPRFSGVS
jgi:fatty acid desaturase